MGPRNVYPLPAPPRRHQRGRIDTLKTAPSAADTFSSSRYDFRNFLLKETDLAKEIDNHGAVLYVAAPGFQISHLGREHERKQLFEAIHATL